MDISKVPEIVRILRNFFAKQFKIFKAPGIVWMQQTLFFQALFYGNIESTWDSADATNPSFPGTSYGKSAGENAEAKNTILSGFLFMPPMSLHLPAPDTASQIKDKVSPSTLYGW